MLLTMCPFLGNRINGSGSADAATSVKYAWPTSCHKITGYWGKESGHKQKYHYGIDIGASRGAKVKAAEAGKVIFSGRYDGYGNCVIIQHSNGQCTLYGHLQKTSVKKKAKVSKGQKIGSVGGTGWGGYEVYPAHLHFGIYKSKKDIDKEYKCPAASKITIDPRSVLKK